VLPLVYVHGGGIHVNIRLEQHKLCTLMMIGSAPTGARSSPPHADGDVEAFILMTGLADEIDAAIAEAVKGLRAYGYSWAGIGSRLGITRRPLSNAGDNAASPAMPHDSDGGKSRSPKILHLGREQPRASSPIGSLDSATDHPS
jgi:hypothetical protein